MYRESAIFSSGSTRFPGSLRLLLCGCLLFLLAACSSAGSASSTASTPTPSRNSTQATTLSPTASVPTITTPLVKYSGHTGPVIEAVWSPDSKHLASCGNDGTVQVWDASTGHTLWKVSLARYVFAVAWSPNGQTVVGAGDNGVLSFMNAANGHIKSTIAAQVGFIEGLVWSPDGKFIASGSQDNTVKVWNVETGKLLFTYSGHTASVARIGWSPDGTRIASASNDQTVQVWDAKTGKALLTYKGQAAPIWAVAWSPDSKRIVSGTGAAGSTGPVTTNNSIKVWNAMTGQTLLTYTGSPGQAYGLAWSPDGTRIASGGDDHIVKGLERHYWPNARTVSRPYRCDLPGNMVARWHAHRLGQRRWYRAGLATAVNAV